MRCLLIGLLLHFRYYDSRRGVMVVALRPWGCGLLLCSRTFLDIWM